MRPLTDDERFDFLDAMYQEAYGWSAFVAAVERSGVVLVWPATNDASGRSDSEAQSTKPHERGIGSSGRPVDPKETE